MVVFSATAVVAVDTVVEFAAGIVVAAPAGVVTAAAGVTFTVPPPLVTGAAATPVIMSTDKATDPWPTVVVPLERALPLL